MKNIKDICSLVSACLIVKKLLVYFTLDSLIVKYMHLHCRTLNNLKRVLNEDALATPPSAMPGSKNDELIVVDDSPVNREMKIKVKCHGIVQRYRIRQVKLTLYCCLLKVVKKYIPTYEFQIFAYISVLFFRMTLLHMLSIQLPKQKTQLVTGLCFILEKNQ